MPAAKRNAEAIGFMAASLQATATILFKAVFVIAQNAL